MTSNANTRMDVVKREDKEGKLKNFISNYLSSAVAGGSARPWQLIARSPESPVILALAALAPQIKAAGYDIETLLTCVSSNLPDSAAGLSLGYGGEVRVCRDHRLLDAHEQLSLGGAHAWIGDCMRREPAKRDGFERYAAGCARTAAWADRAFDRLWARGEPALANVAPLPPAEPQQTEVEAAVALAGVPASTILVSTRH